MVNEEQSQPGPRQWPAYRLEKPVQAAQIRNVTNNEAGRYLVALRDFPIVRVEASFFARGTAQPGDYLVRDAEGHLSWLSKATFEEGHAKVLVDKSYQDSSAAAPST